MICTAQNCRALHACAVCNELASCSMGKVPLKRWSKTLPKRGGNSKTEAPAVDLMLTAPVCLESLAKSGDWLSALDWSMIAAGSQRHTEPSAKPPARIPICNGTGQSKSVLVPI